MTEPRFSTPRGTMPERFRYLFFTPWWRGVWLVGAVIWGVWLNAIVITQPDHSQTLGALSILPVFALAADVIVRSGRIEKRAAAAAVRGEASSDQDQPT